MNNRGDVTITILVIGIFVVCGFALITYFLSDLEKADNFVGPGLMEKINSRVEIDKMNYDDSDPKGNFLKEEEIIERGILKFIRLGKEVKIFEVKYYLK